MENTGYKSFEILERYYTDDGTSTGETKPNVVTDPDYIAPVLDLSNCPPAARYYNTEQTKPIVKNNCSVGYAGSTETLTAYANQFVSNISADDANNQALAWVEDNAQIYANNKGTCYIANAGKITNMTGNTISATYMSIKANDVAVAFITLPALANGQTFTFDTWYTNPISSGGKFVISLFTPTQGITSSNSFYMSPLQNSSNGYFAMTGGSSWTATVNLYALQQTIDIVIK